jgi:hypothetical protein
VAMAAIVLRNQSRTPCGTESAALRNALHETAARSGSGASINSEVDGGLLVFPGQGEGALVAAAILQRVGEVFDH